MHHQTVIDTVPLQINKHYLLLEHQFHQEWNPKFISTEPPKNWEKGQVQILSKCEVY